MPQHMRDGKHSGLLVDNVDGFNVIDCDACGFKHIVPIPTPDELVSLYRDDYYTAEKPLYLAQHAEDASWWRGTYSERFETFEELLPVESRRILDIGSGPGLFLLTGKERGWDVQGIEPSAAAGDHARGLGVPVLSGFFGPETAATLGTFDVIHMSEVLEHIPDPHALVATAVSLLEEGGLLYAMVPNDYNPFQEVLRNACGFEPWWVSPPHHINYFDATSLSRLFEAHGLEVVGEESTFPIDMFLLMGENYVGHDDVGRRCHQLRKNFEMNLAAAGRSDLKREMYRAFAGMGLGRLVAVVAKRKGAE